MMKKKHFIGLSTLLLVLLLGLFSNCYAYRYPLTSDDIMSVLMTYQGDSNSNSVQYRNNIINDFNYLNNKYDTITLSIYGSTNSFIICGFNAEDVTYTTNAKNINYMSAYIDGTYEYYTGGRNGTWVSPSNSGPFSYSNSEFGFGPGSQKNGKYLMYNNDLPGATGPWQSSNIINFVEPRVPLTFIPKSTDTYADVWTYEDVPFYNASGEDLYLGQLLVPSDYQGYKTSTIFYWQYGDWQFKELTDYASYSVYVGSENDSSLYDIYLLKDYINENMLYDITFTDITTEPLYTLASCIFYIKNNYTVINNGALDPHSTFSGDYKDKYDDNLQNLQDIENIQTGTEPILEFLTNTNIPSGEEPTFNDLPSIDIQDDSEEFFTWLLASFLNVLNNNSNTNLTIPLFNNNYTIPSNFFVLNIEPLRTFINLGWWFICGVPFLKFIRSSIEKLKGGNIPLADEKSDLLGHII